LPIDWPTILRIHGPTVWRTALAILNNEPDAADCFQETFQSALAASQKHPIRHWPAFLKRIATARALDMLRKRIRHRKHESHEEPTMLAATGPTPPQHAESQELAARLRRALSRLPTLQSEIYCLRHLSDLTYEQIATELSISTDSVGVNLHRARTRLRELLESASEVNHD